MPCSAGEDADPPDRSEEHTSELQSLMRKSYAVFCLKKKKLIFIITTLHTSPYKSKRHRKKYFNITLTNKIQRNIRIIKFIHHNSNIPDHSHYIHHIPHNSITISNCH